MRKMLSSAVYGMDGQRNPDLMEENCISGATYPAGVNWQSYIEGMDPAQTAFPHRLCKVGIKLNWVDLVSGESNKLTPDSRRMSNRKVKRKKEIEVGEEDEERNHLGRINKS